MIIMREKNYNWTISKFNNEEVKKTMLQSLKILDLNEK